MHCALQMSSAGAGSRSGIGSSGGISSNAARNESLANLRNRLSESCKALLLNYAEVVRLGRPDLEAASVSGPNSSSRLAPGTSAELEQLEASARAANMVRACEALKALVSDVKVALVLGDFAWLAEANNTANRELGDRRRHTEVRLIFVLLFSSFNYIDLLQTELNMVRQEMATLLYELEEELFTGSGK